MNKKIVNEEIGLAYDALAAIGIANEAGEIDKTFRGQISTFGAAISMEVLFQL